MPGGPLAISLGDPAGVGPELIAAAWVRREAEGLLPFCAVGGPELLAEAARRRGLTIPVMPVMSLDEALDCFDRALPTLAGADGAYRPGAPDSEGAELALASLEEATRLTVAGEASALVTGPIAKARLAEVGFGHPGQTEFVAAACGMAPRDAVILWLPLKSWGWLKKLRISPLAEALRWNIWKARSCQVLRL